MQSTISDRFLPSWCISNARPSFYMKIVHISDVHYGMMKNPTAGKAELCSAHYYCDDSLKPDPSVLASILNKDPKTTSPDVCVLSGDLTWSGTSDDYGFARKFLEYLRNYWSKCDFVLIPGNHDVLVPIGSTVDPCPTNDERQAYFVDLVKEFYGSRFSAVFPFFEKGQLHKREDLICVLRRENTLFVGVNSAACINREHDPIVIQPIILEEIRVFLEKHQEFADLLKVFVIHHHLLPFAEPSWATADNVHRTKIEDILRHPDTSIVANSAKLQSWLAENGFSLVLHGHKHIFHGREDSLWKADSDPKRKIIILGAGSAGVDRHYLPQTVHHSLNVVDVNPLIAGNWDLTIATGRISADNTGSIGWWSEEEVVVGNTKRSVSTFEADSMKDCHRLIAKAAKASSGRHFIITNFLSIVHHASYVLPPTVEIEGRPASDEQVKLSFAALHPEYKENFTSWNEKSGLADFYRKRSFPAYRNDHGERMFNRRKKRVDDGAGKSPPIYHSLQMLKKSHVTRAYLGLFDPARDTGEPGEFPPGLVGVQFVPDEGNALDIIMTFRSIELSFWWAVNMYEAIELLHWAVANAEGPYKPGKITFFAGYADWQDNPEPMFIAELDKLPPEEIYSLVVHTVSGSKIHARTLALKLEEKVTKNYTAKNICIEGLHWTAFFIKAVLKDRETLNMDGGPISENFVAKMDNVLDLLEKAVMEENDRSNFVLQAKGIVSGLAKSILAYLESKEPRISATSDANERV
jgi:hypothetical protein